MDDLIRPSTLAKRLSISKRTLFRLMKQPDFPRKIRIGSKAIGFRESEVQEWLERNTEDKNKSE